MCMCVWVCVSTCFAHKTDVHTSICLRISFTHICAIYMRKLSCIEKYTMIHIYIYIYIYLCLCHYTLT